MIVYSKQRLTIAEFHYDEQISTPKVDIIRYQSRPEKVSGTVSYPFSTILIDLRQDEDLLLGQMSKTTRNEVRRAVKDDLTFEFSEHPSRAWLADFFQFYNEFARLKRLPSLNRERITGMCESQALMLSRIKSADGSDLVWHCYVHANGWVRLVHSASWFRAVDKAQQAVNSRANRYLHWLDMLRFRELRYATYDLGGWYSGQEDVEKLNINRFKEGFGGRVVPQYNCDQGVTLKGYLAVHLRHVAGTLRGHR
ncbi:MAG TPA: hypothetical protein VGL72_21430 [Bryobacteraceae bacterium]